MFRKRQLMSGPVVHTAPGAVLSCSAVLDFTQSYPSTLKDKPPSPPYRSAVLRWNHRPAISATAYAPVDPVFLTNHLEFGDGGRVKRVSSALVAFLCRCSAGNLGRRGRLRVGGAPTAATRALTRGTQLFFLPRILFSTKAERCMYRGCKNSRVAGVFCADHYDSTFHKGLSRKDVRGQSRGSVMIGNSVKAELNIIFGDFEGFWVQIGAWLSSGTFPWSPGAVRTLVVNHGVDLVPHLAALSTLSADRIAALIAYCTAPISQGSQTFYNVQVAVQFFRELRDRREVLAMRVGRSLARYRLFWCPLEDSACDFILDFGIIHHPRMPVVPAIEAFAASGQTDGLVCATVVPGPHDVPTALVFSVPAARILSRIFGVIGDFSFSAVAGSLPPLPEGAVVLDAAETLDLGLFSHLSEAMRAETDLYVLTPAALSTTVLDAIVFRLRFRHVFFHGPLLGTNCIALPVFEKIEADPHMVGFYWACLVSEAKLRGTFRMHAGGDPFWRRDGVGSPGFIDTFVAPETPVRCAQGSCRSCSATSMFHADALMAEACFGEQGLSLLPKCAALTFDPVPGAVEEAIELWRTLVDPNIYYNDYNS